MLTQTLKALLLLPVALRVAYAQTSNTSTACNNSPSLCNRAYNDITYLGAHDSPFVRDASTGDSISGNQYFNSTVQLSAGVRLLSAQIQMTNSTSTGQLHVCHTSCDLLDAGKLSDWLGEVNTWLIANPNEVVTVLLVNGADASASALAAEYQEAGIDDIAFTPGTSSSSVQWPSLQTLITNGTRLLNFVATLADNTNAPYLMSEFDYIFENSYENSSPTDFSCDPNRPSSVANNTQKALSQGLMPLMNHFLYEDQAFGIQSPNDTYVNTTNAPSGGVGNLGSAADECNSTYGQAPTFILVDFFNVGPAIDTVDRLNGVTDPVGRTAISTEASQQTSGAATAAYQTVMLCLSVLVSLLLVV